VICEQAIDQPEAIRIGGLGIETRFALTMSFDRYVR
jgi:hypothetical protein